MAMQVGSNQGGPKSDINMTPMIDIMLVLLIIFMILQQGLQKGLSMQVPPILEQAAVPGQESEQLVLEVLAGRQYALNQQPIPADQLEQRLREVYEGRRRKIIFVKAAEDLTYGDVVYTVDTARAAGVEIVGLVPRS